MNENELVDWLKLHAVRCRDEPLLIGDDAALLAMPTDAHLFVTTDMLLDGVHFRLEQDDPRLIGRKALAVNLSDAAAMAAVPTAAVVSIAIPRGFSADVLRAIYEGLFALADRYRVSVAGGDTNTWNGPFAINVCLLGHRRQGMHCLRSNARTGDVILVTGSLGGSLASGRHLSFAPRVEEAALLADRYAIHAMMDISDGLAVDLPRLADASGLDFEVTAGDLPLSSALRQGNTCDAAEMQMRALSDGEDFELLFTAAPDVAARLETDQPLGTTSITRIGVMTPRGTGRILRLGGNTLSEWPTTRGFLHRF